MENKFNTFDSHICIGDTIEYKGLVIYPYRQRESSQFIKYRKLYCVADPNHNYDYDTKGITKAAGFKTLDQAKEWIDSH